MPSLLDLLLGSRLRSPRPPHVIRRGEGRWTGEGGRGAQRVTHARLPGRNRTEKRRLAREGRRAALRAKWKAQNARTAREGLV